LNLTQSDQIHDHMKLFQSCQIFKKNKEIDDRALSGGVDLEEINY